MVSKMDKFFEKQSEFVKWINWRKTLVGGWGQNILADLLGLSQATISRILTGKKTPTPLEVIGLAYAFEDEEHISDLLEMCGYGDVSDNITERRRIHRIMDEHPGFIKSPYWDDTLEKEQDWWEYYRRRERM